MRFPPSESSTGRWLVWDQPCGIRRDVLDLLAKVLKLPDTKGSNYRAVLVEGCRRLGVDPCSIKAGTLPPVAPRAIRREITPAQLREIVELYGSLSPLNAEGHDDVRAWMIGAGLRPDALEAQTRAGSGYRIAGILPVSQALPNWARIGDQTWADAGIRLVATRWAADGSAGWPKARSIEADPWLKSVGPKGGSSRGLVGAAWMYWRLLCLGPEEFMATWRKGLAAAWTRDEHPTLALCEGEKDGLALAGIAPKDVLVGWVDSGSWTPDQAARIPDGTRVLILTDSDGAGMRYQSEIAETLRSRCPVRVLNSTEDHRRGTDGAYLLDEAGGRIKLPDVADLIRDGATWDDLVRRASAWVPAVEEPAVEPAVEPGQGDDLAAICAEVRAEVPSLSMPDEAPTVTPTVAPPVAPPAAQTGRSAREIMEAGFRALHGEPAKPQAKAEAQPQAKPQLAAKAEAKPQPAKPQPTAKAEPASLSPGDPRLAVCKRLGEEPIVTIREGHEEPLVYITSRCCPPSGGEKKLSLYVAKPSRDVLAKCRICDKTTNAVKLRPLTEPVPEVEPAPKTEPKPKAAPKPKTTPKAATKVETEVGDPAKPRPSSALETVITAALAGAPVLREGVVARIRAAGLRPTKAQLREARDAAGVRSYTVADQQWWALAGPALARKPSVDGTVAAERWTN